jgi:hypothetical protein
LEKLPQEKLPNGATKYTTPTKTRRRTLSRKVRVKFIFNKILHVCRNEFAIVWLTSQVITRTVIAAMTVGKDVSMLFTDVVNCMQTDNVELKKLVYLYLINFAKTQPDLAILAVNTFVKVWLAYIRP